jgi:hypothetical protein
MSITVGGTTITLNSGSVLQDPPGTAPSFLCRAWVKFNGRGTVAIDASGNVSSITDNAAGDYTVNFTTAFTDANYAVSGMSGASTTVYFNSFADPPATYTTSACRISTQGFDIQVVCLQVFR